MEIDYSVPPGVRLLEAVSEESETSSIMSASSASVHSISLNSPPESPKEQGTDEEDDGSRKGAPTPPPKGQKSNAEVPKEEAEPVPSGERKSSWRDWLGIGGGGTVDGADTMEELADPEAPPSPAISDTPSTPGGAGPFPYSFLQDPTPSRDSTSSMLVHDGQSSTTSVHSRPRKKQYLLTVVPALNLSTDSPRLKKRAVSR